MKKTTFAKITLFAFSFFLLTQATFAIGISPTRTELSLAPGESEEVLITVTNKTDEDIDAVPEVRVFLRNDEQGFPIPTELAESDVHNIRNWIDISMDPTPIPANGSKDVTFTVNVPEGAEPGGKYGIITYNPVPTDTEGAIRIIARVATLLLINVKGDVVLSGNVQSFGIPARINSDETFYFPVKFENTGNTHVKPTGWIEITDKATGEIIKNTITYIDPETEEVVTSDNIPVNLAGGNVLPDSVRIFKSEWVNNIKTGTFTAKLNLEYTDGQPAITREIDFEIDENLNIDNFQINLGETEASFTLTVTNNGNIYERLAGAINITNNFGYKVAEVTIPEDIEYITPGETKTFTFDWLNVAIPKGRHKATLEATHGLTDSVLTAKVSFGEADYTQLLLLGAGIFILILLIALLVKRKRR